MTQKYLPVSALSLDEVRAARIAKGSDPDTHWDCFVWPCYYGKLDQSMVSIVCGRIPCATVQEFREFMDQTYPGWDKDLIKGLSYALLNMFDPIDIAHLYGGRWYGDSVTSPVKVCSHEYVNISFMGVRLACKHCGQDQL